MGRFETSRTETFETVEISRTEMPKRFEMKEFEGLERLEASKHPQNRKTLGALRFACVGVNE